MLTGMALPYRTYICRCVMLSYLRRLLVVYLSVKVMRRPLLMNKRQRSALFVCTKDHKKEVRSEVLSRFIGSRTKEQVKKVKK